MRCGQHRARSLARMTTPTLVRDLMKSHSTFASRVVSATALASLVACGAAPSDSLESTSSASSCLPGQCTVINPPAQPTPPPSITITSDSFQSMVRLLLDASVLSVDTTHTAPAVEGPPALLPNPAYSACETAAEQSCASLAGTALQFCKKQAANDCKDIPETTLQDQEFTSYFVFSPAAKQENAVDILDSLQTIHHKHSTLFDFFDVDIDFDIDINYVHTTLQNDNFKVYLSSTSTSSSLPSASAYLGNIQSQSPTLIISDSPDLDLTNMSVYVVLNDIAPSADGTSVDYGSVTSYFDFDWDLSIVPDWLVSDAVDVRSLVSGLTESHMDKVLNATTTHKTLSKAFATYLATQIPGGYSSITSVVGTGTSWVITYAQN